MLTVKQFISQKTPQLTFYLKGLWNRTIPYNEVDLFFWDTLEEWTIVKMGPDEPYTQKERVFWHLMHQIHYWPEHKLLHDKYLREELDTCIHFLEDKTETYLPLDCVGIRP